MSVFDWWDQYSESLREDPNFTEETEELLDMVLAGLECEDQHQMVPLFEQACDAAKRLGDEFAELWCELWLLQSLQGIGEIRKSFDMAIQVAIRSRDPKFRSTPIGIMANNLATGRLGSMDPYGRREEIAAAVEYLEKNCPNDSDHACIFYGTMYDINLQIGDFDAAEEYLKTRYSAALAQWQDDDHWFYMAWQYLGETHLAFMRKDWEIMLKSANEGLAEPTYDHGDTSSLTAGQACALAHLGDFKAALPNYRKALKSEPHERADDWFDFLASYHECTGEPDKAIDLRIQQYEHLDGKGSYWEQACAAEDLIRLYLEKNDAENAELWTERLGYVCEFFQKPWHPRFMQYLKPD